MIQEYGDAFVGSVAILVGLFFICSAMTNWHWTYSLPTARGLQRLLGRTGARLFHIMLGLGLVALGLAIAAGYRWPLIGPS